VKKYMKDNMERVDTHKRRINGGTHKKEDSFVIRQLWQKHKLKTSSITLLSQSMLV
jgi:hypothetical protein